MKKLLAAIVCTCCMTLAGCNSGEVKISELSGTDKAMYQGKPFTGKSVTEDGKTGYFLWENGEVAGVVINHDNGEKALERIEKTGTDKFYDEDGKEISESQFSEKYPEKAFAVFALISEMPESMLQSVMEEMGNGIGEEE